MEDKFKSSNKTVLKNLFVLLHSFGSYSRIYDEFKDENKLSKFINTMEEMVWRQPEKNVSFNLSNILSKETVGNTILKITPDVIKKILQELQWMDPIKQRNIISIFDKDYPDILREISGPPILLFVLGNLSCLQRNKIAIVGSRNASRIGEEHAYLFAKNLAECGLVITSGLAIGIDIAAHRGAIGTGNCGATLAVIGSGMDNIYPKINASFVEKILDSGGAIISEFPLGTPPLAMNFPMRNRIISGLCLATVVVEASMKSGSLITARLAAEQGRDVFAIPGSINSANVKGCHHLIKNGAKLTDGVVDILEELQDQTYLDIFKKSTGTIEKVSNAKKLDADLQQILDCIDTCCTSVDTILARLGNAAVAVENVLSALVILEMKGYVIRTNDGYERG